MYIKDNIKLYNAATPAPSVAVNTPFTIPPIVMTIKSKLGIALHVIINLSLKDICSLTTLVLFFIDVKEFYISKCLYIYKIYSIL